MQKHGVFPKLYGIAGVLSYLIYCCFFTNHEHWRQIAIGKHLIWSPAFPRLHTVRAAFTAHGVPSNLVIQGVQHFMYDAFCQIRLVAFPPPFTFSRLHRYYATTFTETKNGYCLLAKVFPSTISQPCNRLNVFSFLRSDISIMGRI